MQILMGTGSYSNDDWGGLLYPEGTKKTDYLRVYAQHYNAVEINSSFYNIPGAKAFAGMAERAGGRLQFAVKLHQTFTHLRHYDTNDLERMLKSPEPLREQGILGPFLAQFPYSFHRTAENRKYLWELTQHFDGEQLALELRHGSWDKDEVREGFSEHGLIWVSPDYPRLEGMTDSLLRSSGKTAYLRLHGRNNATWWEGKDAAERHDYRYSESELKEIAGDIAALGSDAHARLEPVDTLWVVFNNTTKGHALYNIQMLKNLLEGRGLKVQGKALEPGVLENKMFEGGLFGKID